jgi:hypothetical protein
MSHNRLQRARNAAAFSRPRQATGQKTGGPFMETIKTKRTAIDDETLQKWQKVVDIMAQVLKVPSALVTRIDPPQIEVLRAAAVPGNPYRTGDKVMMAKHYCEAVIAKNSKITVSHAPSDPFWNAAPEIEYGMMAYLGYPLCWPGGEMFGTICVLDSKENMFGELYERVIGEFRELVESHLSLLDMNEKLRNALSELKILRGLLPICSSCKSIRDDKGYWNQIESYIQKHSEAEFSHSICPECARKLYPDVKISSEY